MSAKPTTCAATILDDEGTMDVPIALIHLLDLKPGDRLVYRIEEEGGKTVVVVEKADQAS